MIYYNEKRDRNLEILKLAKNGERFAPIGRKYVISTERVRSIIKKFGYTAKDFMDKRNHVVYLLRCNNCGKEFIKLWWNCLFCSKKCRHETFSKIYRFNGEIYQSFPSNKKRKRYKGTTINGRGYLKHRVIFEKHFGVKLKTTDCVHHEDGNGLNNNIKNLKLLDRRKHASLESKRWWELFKKTGGIKDNLIRTIKIPKRELRSLTKIV